MSFSRITEAGDLHIERTYCQKLYRELPQDENTYSYYGTYFVNLYLRLSMRPSLSSIVVSSLRTGEPGDFSQSTKVRLGYDGTIFKFAAISDNRDQAELDKFKCSKCDLDIQAQSFRDHLNRH